MSNTIREILERLEQKSYLNAHSPGYTKLNNQKNYAAEALADIERLLEKAKPRTYNDRNIILVKLSYHQACEVYSANIKRILK